MAASAVMVAAIATPATALKYPPDAPSFGGCENSGWVLWEFVDDYCLPTSDEFDPPYGYYPALTDPTFGGRHFDPCDGWGSNENYEYGWPWDWEDGVFTILSEDVITQSIPARGSKQYLRQYFEVVHTLVPGMLESDYRWPIGLGIEIWDMSVYPPDGWTGCPIGYENLTGDGYRDGYEFIPPEIHYELGGGWYKSVWIHDFSTDGSVYSGEYPASFDDLFEVTHTACIVGMDLDPEAGEIFQIEEVLLDFIWYDDPDGNDIPTVPEGSLIGLSSVEIDPPQPSSSDVIAITLSGQWNNRCGPNGSVVWIDGDEINFEVVLSHSACMRCPFFITPWELTDYIGPLPSGTYTVYGYMYRDPNSPVADPFTFVVSDHYHVDAVDGNDLNDGLSWETAFATIQKGIDTAENGDTVIVADGTYTGDGNRDIDFLGKAITVKSANGPESCVIDCQGSEVEPHRGFYFHQSEGQDSVVQGFTITNGLTPCDPLFNHDIFDPYFYDPCAPWVQDPCHPVGGGIYCEFASPTITNCVITECGAELGGGIGCVGGECVIVDCTIDGCYAGGLGLAESGGHGAGIGLIKYAQATITNCKLTGNRGYYNSYGGGLYLVFGSAEISDCLISGNSAWGWVEGAGLYCGPVSYVTVENSIITQNTANDADGGGIFCSMGSDVTLINCTLSDNSADYDGGGIFCETASDVVVTNGILWGDTPDEVYLSGGDPCVPGGLYVTYTAVQGGYSGTGNIDADPLFVDPNGPDGIVGTEDDNLRLKAGSPCINAGDNSVVDLYDTDLDGNPRIINGTVDMGAYEFGGIIYVDDDAPGDPGPGDPDVSDPAENGTEAHPFDEIQEGIDVAHDGDTVIVNEGLYLGQLPWESEEINFLGKNITLTSTDPTDPNMTVIRGTVQFSGTENSNCTLRGFRIHDLGFGAIYGNGTQATISHCVLSGNGPCGATVIENCDGIISNCLITDNTTVFLCGIYPVVFGCHGVIKNCTIANNASGISILDGAEATIENCIIYYNDESFTPQLSVGAGGTLNISYCDVQGGLGGISGAGIVNPGPGNIDTDPCFAQLGYWQEEPFELIEGDYHLKSEGWRWRGILAHGSYWTYDYVTSRCIDAANPGSPLGQEVMTVLPDDPENEWGENLRRNMGAYGGTAEASMPPYGWALLADLTNDGIVNLADFAGQAADWLTTEDEQPGDVNRDGVVDIIDVTISAQDWLEVTTWSQ